MKLSSTSKLTELLSVKITEEKVVGRSKQVTFIHGIFDAEILHYFKHVLGCGGYMDEKGVALQGRQYRNIVNKIKSISGKEVVKTKELNFINTSVCDQI